MRKRAVAAFVFGLSTVVASAQKNDLAHDPILGTWELNVAKSTFTIDPPERSEKRTYSLVGEEIKATSTSVMLDGQTVTGAWTVAYDGKDRPETGNNSVDSLSLTRTDPYHVSGVEKKNGKVVNTVTRVISEDGKTMTITQKGRNAKGEAVTQVAVFEKK